MAESVRTRQLDYIGILNRWQGDWNIFNLLFVYYYLGFKWHTIGKLETNLISKQGAADFKNFEILKENYFI